MQLLEETVELEGAHVVNRRRFDKVRWQRRFMAAVTLSTLVAALAFIVALATPYWAIIEFTNKDLQHVHVRLGVWGEWRTVSNDSSTTVEWMPHFPEPPSEVLRLANWDLNHYYRAQAAFGVISLVLMIANNGLAIWTFRHHRYMYKRLVASLHAFTGCDCPPGNDQPKTSDFKPHRRSCIPRCHEIGHSARHRFMRRNGNYEKL